MKFKSALVTQASGSVGGITFGNNKGGLYVRSRAIPTNPNSASQQSARAALTDTVNAWTSILTQAQRDAWITYAANTPVVDVFGDSKLITGQQHYIRSNSPRKRFGEARVDDGPTTFNLGTFTNVSFAVSAAAPTDLVVSFTNTDEWATAAGGFLFVTASRGQNASKEFFKAPFRFAEAIVGDAIAPTSPATLTSPFSYVEGQKVFINVTAAQLDGRYSSAQIVSTIVTA